MTALPGDPAVRVGGTQGTGAPGPTPEPERGGRKKLLLVSYHFPPSPAVGALRWAGLTRHLADLGWEIRVISGFPPDGQPSVNRRIDTRGVARRRTWNDRYIDWKTRRNGERSSAEQATSRNAADPDRKVPPRDEEDVTEKSKGRLRGLVRRLGALLAWPDEGRGWVLRTAREIRAALRDFRPEVIVSSGPPHSAHLAVLLGGASRNCRWILDWRDPWHYPPGDEMHGVMGIGPVTSAANAVLERAAVNRAERVLVTTPELRDELIDRFRGVSVEWLPNGVDLEAISPPSSPPFAGLSLVHLGTLYAQRDPTTVLRAFRNFLRRNPEALAAGSRIRFVGSVESPHAAEIERECHGVLAERVGIMGALPRSEALDILQRSSLAIVLAQRQQTMVPAKIYESIALGIPTLVVTEPGSATDRTAERFGLFKAAPTDTAGIEAVLECVWGGGAPPEPLCRGPVTHRELAAQADRILTGYDST